jgi:hypothetical protein
VQLPIVVFAFLFGVSMDYQVFIISRMREAYDRTRSTEAAVVEGIGRTGRLVTSAALILGLSFVAFSATPGTEAKIFATALGGGILLDATIIRGLLAPAFVAILGRWTWWLPDWAARILRVEPSPVPPTPLPNPLLRRRRSNQRQIRTKAGTCQSRNVKSCGPSGLAGLDVMGAGRSTGISAHATFIPRRSGTPPATELFSASPSC